MKRLARSVDALVYMLHAVLIIFGQEAISHLGASDGGFATVPNGEMLISIVIRGLAKYYKQHDGV